MAVKYIHEDSSDQSGGDKPLLRNWCKDQTKAGNDPYETPLVVRCLKESRNGEWLVVELNDSVALVPAKSSLGSNLLDLMPKLKGEGNALVVVPHKKGKLGFSVGIDDETRVYYKWNEDEEYLWVTNKHVPQKESKPTITLDALLSPQSPQSSGNGNGRKKTPKPNAEEAMSDAKTALEDA